MTSNACVLTLLFLCIAHTYASTCWHGVNLAGLDFGSPIGVYGKDYIAPTPQEVDYYISKGMNAFRLPFLWERMQESLFANFNSTFLGYVDGVVNYATQKGAFVLIDPHNYARYFGKVIGDAVPVNAFQDFWTKLASHYASNPRVIFGLMNEPNTMKTELWLSDANAAIAAIRATGAKNLITVPGNAWTGAASWDQNWYGTPNSQVMLEVKDPENNFVFEVHQYLDSDSSGTHPDCVSNTIGSTRLASFTQWCKQHGYRAWLGEWAGGRNDVCYQAVTDVLNFINNNLDVYKGWTWWAGGPWWSDYMYTLDPDNGQDRPQMQYLKPYLTPGQC